MMENRKPNNSEMKEGEQVDPRDAEGLSDLLEQFECEGQTTATRDAISSELCKKLRLQSLVIRRHLGDPPIFHMVVNGAEGRIGRVEHITSQRKFRERVAECVPVLLPRIKPREWDECAQAILYIAEDVDLGDASHPSRQTTENLRVYLSQYFVRPADAKDAAARAGEPFWYQESLWISTRDYGKWMRRELGDMVSQRQICVSFHAIDMKPKAIHYNNEEDKGKKRRTSGQFWKVPAKIVAELGLSERK